MRTRPSHRPRRVAGRPRTVRRCAGLLAVLVLTGLALLAGTPATQAAPFDCKSAPTPASPSDGIRGWTSPRPAEPPSTNALAPWEEDGVSIASMYGYAYSWQVYDVGCADSLVGWTKVQNDLANLVASGPINLRALANQLYALLANPDWRTALDWPMVVATEAVNRAVRAPWIGAAFAALGALLLWRARQGRFAALATATGWAFGMLLLGSLAVQWPVTSAHTVDGLVTSAVTSIGQGFCADGCEGLTPAEIADRQIDQINRRTLYRAWVMSALGDPDGPTAEEFGPLIFATTHLTWAEADTVRDDPGGAGADLIKGKQKLFELVAGELNERDELAYQQLTGNRGRWAGLGYDLVTAATVDVFLIIALLFGVIAFVVIRLAVPLLPAISTLGVFEATAPHVKNAGGRLLQLLINGPLFLLAALISLGISEAALTADGLPLPLRLIFAGGASIILWRLLRPITAFGALTGATRSAQQGGHMATMAAAALIARRRGRGNGEDTDDEDDDGDSTEKGHRTWWHGRRRRRSGAADGTPVEHWSRPASNQRSWARLDRVDGSTTGSTGRAELPPGRVSRLAAPEPRSRLPWRQRPAELPPAPTPPALGAGDSRPGSSQPSPAPGTALVPVTRGTTTPRPATVPAPTATATATAMESPRPRPTRLVDHQVDAAPATSAGTDPAAPPANGHTESPARRGSRADRAGPGHRLPATGTTEPAATRTVGGRQAGPASTDRGVIEANTVIDERGNPVYVIWGPDGPEYRHAG